MQLLCSCLRVQLWNLENMLPIQTFSWHEDSVTAFTIFGDLLFIGSEDTEIKVSKVFSIKFNALINHSLLHLNLHIFRLQVFWHFKMDMGFQPNWFQRWIESDISDKLFYQGKFGLLCMPAVLFWCKFHTKFSLKAAYHILYIKYTII